MKKLALLTFYVFLIACSRPEADFYLKTEPMRGSDELSMIYSFSARRGNSDSTDMTAAAILQYLGRGSGNSVERMSLNDQLKSYHVKNYIHAGKDRSYLQYIFPERFFPKVYPLLKNKLLYPHFPDTLHISPADDSVLNCSIPHTIPEPMIALYKQIQNQDASRSAPQPFDVTAETLNDLYENQFSVRNMSLILSGQMPPDLRSLLISDFSSFHRYSIGEKNTEEVVELTPDRGRRIWLSESDKGEIPGMLIVFPLDMIKHSNDYYGIKLLSTWLGDCPGGGGLFEKALVRQRAIATKSVSSLELRHLGDNGLALDACDQGAVNFYIYLENVTPDDAVFALRYIVHSMNSLLENGWDQNTFDDLKQKHLYRMSLETGDIAFQGRMADASRCYGSEDLLNVESSVINSMSSEAAYVALNKYINTDQMMVFYRGENPDRLENALKYHLRSSLKNSQLMRPEIRRENAAVDAEALQFSRIERFTKSIGKDDTWTSR